MKEIICEKEATIQIVPLLQKDCLLTVNDRNLLLQFYGSTANDKFLFQLMG